MATSSGGCLEIVKYLVDEKNVDPGVKNSNGDTPLRLAICHSHSKVIRYLVDEKVEPDLQDKHDILFHLATPSGGCLEIAKYLVGEKNVGPDLQDEYGILFHLATSSGDCLEIVKYLAGKKSVDSNLQDKDGNAPLHGAAENNKLDTVQAPSNEMAVPVLENRGLKTSRDFAEDKNMILEAVAATKKAKLSHKLTEPNVSKVTSILQGLKFK